MIQVDKNCEVIKEIKCKLAKSMQVRIMKKTYILVVIYNPPRTDKMFFIEQFDSLLDRLSLKNTPVIICGDINIDIMRYNLATSKYLDVITSNGFNILNQEPTTIMEMAQTCLDQFIV